MDTSSLTWSDKYFPDGESYTSVSHDKGFHAACVEIVGDNLSAKGFLESCTWNILDRGFHDSFIQPPPSFVALRTGRLKSSLALELMHAISNRLPIEICERYVEIEGRNYVKPLSTIRMNENDTKILVAEPNFSPNMQKSPPVDNITFYLLCLGLSAAHGGSRNRLLRT
ncbi:hypothetical protein NW764_001453 [Fusarium oxysporum]|nr:hypothetical protein NW764_001453 [Fusarium oxysporum]